MALVYLGIDPGFSGAIAALDQNGCPFHGELHDTPMIAVRSSSRGPQHRQYDVEAMATLIKNACLAQYDQVLAVLEESQAMPGQGVRSMFSIGMGFGVWLGILGALGVPYIRVRPAVWKRRMELPADKEAVRLRAIEQFPGADLHRKKDHGRAESLFLALYGLRTRALSEVAS